MLTIAIPTYNRPEKLVRTLNALLPACRPEVGILVVDNASDINIEDYVREKIPSIGLRVAFHRNRANVGLVANICRCYELASTPWIWTVGDDDSPAEQAIEHILLEIGRRNDDKSLLGINFSTSLFEYQDTCILHNLDEYWKVHQEPMAFSNALFLASCVFKTENVLKYLRIGYQQAFTAASHISIPIAALSDGLCMAIAKPVIMNLVPAQGSEGWNWVTVFAGIPILAEHPGDSVTIAGIARPLAYFAPGLRIRTGLRLILSNSSRDPGYWYIYYSRLVPCLKGRKLLIAMIFRWIAGVFYRLPHLRKVFFGIMRLAKIEPMDSAKGNARL